MFVNKITKDEVNELPLKSFEGEIMLIETLKDAKKALNELFEEQMVGFDTESKPAFNKGEYNHVSLLQFSTEYKAYLFRINKFDFGEEIAELMEAKHIKKIGVALRDDIIDMNKIYSFNPESIIDLNEVAPRLEIQNAGARNLGAIFLGFRISKSQQTSNWELPILSEKQMRYAATDAWICLKIYQKMIGFGLKDQAGL